MTNAANNTKIIYVEDDAGLARLVQIQLERAGYKVDLATDGEQGLAMIRDGDYQVVLVDYLLPKLDGLSLIRTLAEEGILPPTIMVSGISELKVAVEILKLGVKDYILKEPDSGYLERLPALIERIMEKQRLLEEKVQAEAALQQAKQAAEDANQAKSLFLAAASHDLRQPLQSIALLNSVLRRKVQDRDTLKLIEDQGSILQSITDTLNTLLDLSKCESGVVTPRLIDFPVGQVIDKMDTEFRGQAQAKGLGFRTVLAKAIIRSDPVLLERIVQNFLSNAIKYTKAGKVLLGCRNRGRNLRIEVWDTGIGFPEDERRQIFEAFYQLDNAAREAHKGLGLGLSIVDQLAGLLEHRLDVRSVPGKGSLFAVEVPLVARSGYRPEAREWAI